MTVFQVNLIIDVCVLFFVIFVIQALVLLILATQRVLSLEISAFSILQRFFAGEFLGTLPKLDQHETTLI